MSSSLATSVTPDHPRRDNSSITEMALSTDCTEELLRATAHISADPTPPSVSWLDPPGVDYWSVYIVGLLLPERSYVFLPGKGARTTVLLLRRLPIACWLARPWSRSLSSEPVEAEEGDVVAGESTFSRGGAGR